MPLRNESGPTGQSSPHRGVEASHRPVPIATILTVFAVAITLLAAWKLVYLLLMGFAAILIGVALYHLAAFVEKYTPLSRKLGVVVVLALIVAFLTALVMLAGPQIAQQARILFDAIPHAWADLSAWLSSSSIGQIIIDQVQPAVPIASPEGAKAARAAADSMPGVFGFLRGTLNAVVGGVANIVLIITVAIFLALDPGTYVEGVVRLVPLAKRDNARAVMQELGRKLWSWIAGQALDMLIVAILTGAGLWMLGIPLALVLGIIAGLTNIIPFVGPFLSGIPAVLFSLTQGPKEALYVAILFVIIQQIEGNVIMPIIQRRAAGLPPVLTVGGVIGFGVLFGLPGILVAAPLMLVAMVLTQRLYVEGVLGDDLPDDPEDQPEKG